MSFINMESVCKAEFHRHLNKLQTVKFNRPVSILSHVTIVSKYLMNLLCARHCEDCWKCTTTRWSFWLQVDELMSELLSLIYKFPLSQYSTEQKMKTQVFSSCCVLSLYSLIISFVMQQLYMILNIQVLKGSPDLYS